MRIGINPQRHRKVNLGDFFHQVIIPVYIPKLNDYYNESFEIFKLCIGSLLKTSHSKTYISIISNDSCKEVNDYIINLYNDKKIQDFTITKGIGKVNAILKGLSGIDFPLVTITDADVLFTNDWQKATYEVFNNFTKAAVVSTTPNPNLSFYKTSNIFRENLFNRKIKLDKIKNKSALLDFALSIDKINDFQNLSDYYTIKNNDFKAVIGAGHFCATYKTNIFNHNFERFTKYLLGGMSVNNLLDKKAYDLNLWRLSTTENYTYHMGNTVTDKYIAIYNNLNEESEKFNLEKKLNNIIVKNRFFLKYTSYLNRFFESYKIRNLIIKKIIK